MVISGKIRGNAPQLANYLLSKGENERITILEAGSRYDADELHLKNLLYSMELNSQLTKSSNSVYHAFINPNPSEKEDRAMTVEEWHRSADILAKHLNLDQQRRVIVLHEKNDRIHAHVVFERYDYDRGTMIDYKHNYNAHDKARFEMEREFGHKQTPQKNQKQLQHKKTLTEIWNTTTTSEKFMNKAKEHGYLIAKGADRPFRVIDDNGRSFDLVKQLDGIKTKEVRERFKDEELVSEKEAISQVKDKKAIVDTEPKREIVLPIESELNIRSKNIDAANDDSMQSKDEDERLEREFIEKIKAERERNRQNTLLRTFCFAALLMLRVAVDKYLISDRRAFDHFLNNKVSIVSPANRGKKQALGFVETAQFYKPT